MHVIHYFFTGFYKPSFVLDGRDIVVNQMGRRDPSPHGTYKLVGRDRQINRGQ